MLLLFPNRAPHRDIIKAAVQQPGHRLVHFEPRQCLTHRLKRPLHLGWLTDKIGRLTTKEPMIQQAAPSRR